MVSELLDGNSRGQGRFNIVTYTGDGNSTQAITGVGFSPDLVAVKALDAATNWCVADSVIGVGYSRGFNTDSADNSTGPVEFDSFNADGFTVGDSTVTNNSGVAYIAFCWQKGEGYLDIVTYTGDGNSTQAIAHALNAVPAMMLVKNTTVGTRDWQVYHEALDASGDPEDYVVELNQTGAAGAGVWGGVAPTGTEITVGSGTTVNESGETFVAYLFGEKTGMSFFGNYTGNGSATGPTVSVGFEPDLTIVKGDDATGSWTAHNSVRDASNPVSNYLLLDSAAVEGTSGRDIDFNATDFQLKTTEAEMNTNTSKYIAAAWVITE